MSVINAKEFLKKYNLDGDIITFDTSTATVKEAAESIGCEEDEIAKTLSFLIDDNPIIIVMSGNSRIDNNKYRHFFGKKAKMIPASLVNKLIGHDIGGVGPFGVYDNVKIYLDTSLKKYEYVYPACGESNNAIKISISKLEEILDNSKWICVTKENDI